MSKRLKLTAVALGCVWTIAAITHYYPPNWIAGATVISVIILAIGTAVAIID